MKKKTSDSAAASPTEKPAGGRAGKEEIARMKKAILLILESYGPQTTKELHARMGGKKRLLGYVARALVRDGYLSEFMFAAKHQSDGSLPRIWSLKPRENAQAAPEVLDDDEISLIDLMDQPDSIASMKGITTEDLEWMQYYSQPRIERQRDRIQSGGYRA